MEFLNKTLVLLDIFKKKIYYNKQIDDVLFEKQFHKSMNHIFSLCADKTFNINEIFELNIAKLMKRYVDKFSSESAINRNLEEERKIMEGF